MSSFDFRKLAGDALSPADAAFLDRCSLNPTVAGNSGVPVFIRNWGEWETALRLNLARFRAPKVKQDPSDQRSVADAPEYPADAAAAAKVASGMDSPLEAELFLDESRWKAIDTFQGIEYFGVNTVYAYLLKLLLMERRSSFRTEEGFAEYKGLYTAVMEAAVAGDPSAAGASPNSNESGEPK
jgi:hypothetical protein